MKPYFKKNFLKKRLTKDDREEAVLFSLISTYIETAHPIGSETLKTNGGLEYLSSATIRNYFSKLEKEGFLMQSHASGGRIPTELGYRRYANSFLIDPPPLSDSFKKNIESSLKLKDQAVLSYLVESIEKLSEWTHSTIFLTSPRFDQDFIYDLKLVPLENRKLLYVLITHFGLVRTETLLLPKVLKEEQIKALQDFLLWKIGRTTKNPQKNMDKELLKTAHYCTNEILMRHIVGYAHSQKEDLYRTGLSKLIAYPEFSDPMILAKNLALFEDFEAMNSLLSETMKIRRLTLWIGSELQNLSLDGQDSSVLAIPYSINEMTVGAIALLGPTRMNYPELFGILTTFSKTISKELSETITRHKITFRPSKKNLETQFLQTSPSILLEDKTQSF